jgi:signal transduction histidine kinase
VEISSLLREIKSSTSRISDLVGAIKEYTHMDQAPVQNVDVVKGLETTLTIWNHKLKRGVAVQRDYHPVPLLVNSFGSELNQVWTNVIDNAIDAMHGIGEGITAMRTKLVTNSSPKLANFRRSSGWSETEKRSRQRDLAFRPHN